MREPRLAHTRRRPVLYSGFFFFCPTHMREMGVLEMCFSLYAAARLSFFFLFFFLFFASTGGFDNYVAYEYSRIVVRVVYLYACILRFIIFRGDRGRFGVLWTKIRLCLMRREMDSSGLTGIYWFPNVLNRLKFVIRRTIVEVIMDFVLLRRMTYTILHVS